MPKRLLEEVMELYKSRQVSPDLIQKLDASSPMGSIFANGLRSELASRDAMKASMEEAGSLVAHKLEKYLPALGTIATVAPLMGLFGTVVGMIEIFGAQAPTGTNPQQLAYGISVALYNTGLGILVAIPAMIFYRFFRTKVDDYLVEMEQQSSKFIDMVKGPRK
jgi:biopolymer transport protein ExbB